MKYFRIILLIVCLSSTLAIAGENEWTYVGLYPEYITDIVIHPNCPETLYVSASDIWWDSTREGGIFKTTDHGLTWDTVGLRHLWPQDLAFDPQHPETLWAAVYMAGTWRSIDGGTSWENRSNGLYLGGVDSYGAVTIAVSPFDPNLLICGGECATGPGWLYRTTNGGELWTHVDIGFNDSFPKVIFDSLSPGRIFAIDGSRPAIWVSEDSGATFQEILTPFYVHDLVLDPFRRDWLWSMEFYAFRYSSDAGSTWIEPNSSFPPEGYSGGFVRVSPSRINTVFATDHVRVFQTEDGGLGWHEFSEGWPVQYSSIDAISVVATSPTELWAGLTYYGILSYTVVDTSNVVESSGPEANEMNLSIYPNPANNILYLNISPSRFSGNFSLYNILGQRVFCIPLPRSNSVHAIALPHTLPSGTYFGSFIPQVQQANIPAKAYPVVIVK